MTTNSNEDHPIGFAHTNFGDVPFIGHFTATEAAKDMDMMYGVAYTPLIDSDTFLMLGEPSDEVIRKIIDAYHGDNYWEMYDIRRTNISFTQHDPDCETMSCGCTEEVESECPECWYGYHEACTEACFCAEDYDHSPAQAECGCLCDCESFSWWASPSESESDAEGVFATLNYRRYDAYNREQWPGRRSPNTTL